jgi:hypothetical protein
LLKVKYNKLKEKIIKYNESDKSKTNFIDKLNNKIYQLEEKHNELIEALTEKNKSLSTQLKNSNNKNSLFNKIFITEKRKLISEIDKYYEEIREDLNDDCNSKALLKKILLLISDFNIENMVN